MARYALFFLGLCGSTFAIAQTALPGLKISRISKSCFVYTTYNTFNGEPFPSNSMYVITDQGVVLIDTPWDPAQFQPLLDSIQQRHKKKVVACIATHFHADRTAGLEFLQKQGIVTYSSRLTQRLCRERNEKVAELTFTNDTTFIFGKQTLKTFYPGAGHSRDNLVVWIENEKVLFGGCFVKSTEASDLGNVADADIPAWDRSIQNVQKEFADPKVVVPGHFGWESTKSLEHTRRLISQYKKD